MTPTKLLIGQIVVVLAIVIAGVWFATEWAAYRLAWQPELGGPLLLVGHWPIYRPWSIFPWWYHFDAYAPHIFDRAGAIAGASGFAGCGAAVSGSLWRARQLRRVTTYGSARWADHQEIARAGLVGDAGLFLGQHEHCYLRHDGPEHVMAFAPTRSGKGVGLVVPTLLGWTGSAVSLINQAKNLTTISFPELTALQQMIQQIDQLMGQAQGIQFRVANLDQQFRSLFPTSFNQALTNDQHVAAARTRLDTSMAAYKQTMTVQAQVVENIAADETTLNGIVSRSQGAEGALQASQATNQLLALVAKQQFQIEQLMTAQYRADAIERANRNQAQSDAQSATAKFLGSGNAYNPQ